MSRVLATFFVQEYKHLTLFLITAKKRKKSRFSPPKPYQKTSLYSALTNSSLFQREVMPDAKDEQEKEDRVEHIPR